MAEKIWGGRFQESPTAAVEAFTASIGYDIRLAPADIKLSKAHATMLCSCGLLSADETVDLHQVLGEAETSLKNGTFLIDPALEDIHMHLEVFLTRRLGDTGRKIHTGRSRNDQVATAFRIWCRDHIDVLTLNLTTLQKALVCCAERHQGAIIPAYTHWQRAQPMVASQHFLAHVERLDRDRQRLRDTRSRVNLLPLGSAAAVGSSLPLNRELVAELLDFDGVCTNSLDATSDRDFALDFAYNLMMIAQHLASMAEEWIMWSTTEFDFVQLPDRFCTGSSIMPQKKNPDVLELIRGRTGRAVGALMQLITTVKGLPLGYQRDLQEDKIPLFTSYDSVSESVTLLAALVDEMELKDASIQKSIHRGYLDATSVMEFLIEQGTPMRVAHEKVGKLVHAAESAGGSVVTLNDLPLSVLETIDPLLATPQASLAMGADHAARRLRSQGGGGHQSVANQIKVWNDRLSL